MLKQRIELWAGREAFRQKVEAVQQDGARTLECTLMDTEVPEGAELRFFAKKPSGKKIYNVASGSGNTITVKLTKQVLAEAGILPCQLEMVDTEGRHLTTFRFDIHVISSQNPDSSVESMEETDVLRSYVEQAKQSAEEAAGSKAGAESARDEASKQAGKASASAAEAKTAQSAAEDAKTAAETARDTAKGHADAAAQSESAAATSAGQAENWSNMSKSWAVGDAGGARGGENTDNSKYYAGLAAQSETAAAGSAAEAKTQAQEAKTQAGASSQSAAKSAASALEAQDAQKAAELAKTQAEGAKTDAESAKTDAQAARDQASQSAADAETQAKSAAQSALQAETAAAAADTAKTDAETAKDAAEAARVAAEKARDEAAGIAGGDFATNESLKAHTGDTDIHITAAERKKWDGHIADTAIHVTEEQKTAWTAKADTASVTAAVSAHNTAKDAHSDIRSNLALKADASHTHTAADVGAFPADAANPVLGADYNTLITTGVYRPRGQTDQAVTNQPPGLSATDSDVILVVFTISDTRYCTQLAFDVRSNNAFSRSCLNGGWSEWEQIYTSKTLPSFMGKPALLTLTLSGGGWSESGEKFTQQVSADGILADETAQEIHPMPKAASMTAYQEAGIYCSGQEAGKLTFTALSKPETDLGVYVTVWPLK